MFDAARLSKSPALFDSQKLKWMNNQYMKKQDLDTVVELSLPHLVKAGRVGETLSEQDQAWIRDVIALYHEQMSFGAEIVELSEMFFKDHVDYEEEGQEVLNGEQVPEVLRAFAGQIEALEAMEPAAIKAAIKAVQKETGHKGKIYLCQSVLQLQDKRISRASECYCTSWKRKSFKSSSKSNWLTFSRFRNIISIPKT